MLNHLEYIFMRNSEFYKFWEIMFVIFQIFILKFSKCSHKKNKYAFSWFKIVWLENIITLYKYIQLYNINKNDLFRILVREFGSKNSTVYNSSIYSLPRHLRRNYSTFSIPRGATSALGYIVCLDASENTTTSIHDLQCIEVFHSVKKISLKIALFFSFFFSCRNYFQ